MKESVYFKEYNLYDQYGHVVATVDIIKIKPPKLPVEMVQWGSRYFYNRNVKDADAEPYYVEGMMYVTKGNPLPYIK